MNRDRILEALQSAEGDFHREKHAAVMMWTTGKRSSFCFFGDKESILLALKMFMLESFCAVGHIMADIQYIQETFLSVVSENMERMRQINEKENIHPPVCYELKPLRVENEKRMHMEDFGAATSVVADAFAISSEDEYFGAGFVGCSVSQAYCETSEKLTAESRYSLVIGNAAMMLAYYTLVYENGDIHAAEAFVNMLRQYGETIRVGNRATVNEREEK